MSDDTVKIICPACKREEGVPVVYGTASLELHRASQRQGFVMGGCCRKDGDPTLACLACGHRWTPGDKKA